MSSEFLKGYCFLDLDGVLTSFMASLCSAHGRPDPYDDPKNLGIFEAEDIWGISHKDFWRPASEISFWEDMEPTVEKKALVKLCEDFFDKRTAILTAPTRHENCLVGKRRWINKHMAGYKKKFLIGSCKEACAGPHKYLVDDRDENIRKFNEAGGTGILFPRPWNSLHSLKHDPVGYVHEQLHAMFVDQIHTSQGF